MRFASFAGDGEAVLPATRTWFRASGPFTTACSAASQVPYVSYNGTRSQMTGNASDGYYCYCSVTGAVEAVIDDVLTSVSFADPESGTPNIVDRLMSVDAIGSNVTSLAARAFLDCGRLGPRFEPMYYGAGLSLGESCFEGCYGIREFSPRFLSKVVSSGAAAFARCSGLRTIAGMSAFDPCAAKSFYRCTGLESLVGGFSAATTFGVKCFDGCSSLTSLAGLPDSAETLEEYCFARCSALTDITALASTSVVELSDRCFFGCTSLASPNCGTGSAIVEFGNSCFERCSALVSMSGIPQGLKVMGARCFADSALGSLFGLPSSLKELGEECFAECSRLVTLVGLPTSLTTVGARCFRDCYWEDHPVNLSQPEKVSTEGGLSNILSMKDVVEGLTQIGVPDGCFAGDRMIRALPDFSEYQSLFIGEYAFSGCSGLDTIEGLPYGVELREGAFSECYRSPHDWFQYDTGSRPIRKVTRWCGLYAADMSSFTTDRLPARCFEGCGALAELPPLPPDLMEMGAYCFAGCSGMKNLDSLADLALEITEGSTHFDGNAHGPTYPSFGEWCFSGCGTEEAGQGWVFFNNPSHPPQIGKFRNFNGGLKALCDRLEYEAACHMSASSSALMGELLGYLASLADGAMEPVVDYPTWSAFYEEGALWDPDFTVTRSPSRSVVRSGGNEVPSAPVSPAMLLIAGTVAPASAAAASGYSVFTGELTEVQDQSHPNAVDGTRHDIIAILMPAESGHRLWVCSPGVRAELGTNLDLTQNGTTTLTAISAPVTVTFTITVINGSITVSAGVTRDVNTVVDPVTLTRIAVSRPNGAEGVALAFMKFMAYAVAGQVMKDFSATSTAIGSGVPLSKLTTYVISRLTDGAAALAKLRDLNLVTPASTMLGDHCFDGCTYLTGQGFPSLIADVPPYCFANTAVSSLAPFAHVYSMGMGAFMDSAVASVEGYPRNVAYVSSRLFQNCPVGSLAPLPRYIPSFGAYAFAGCTALDDATCTATDPWATTDDVPVDLSLELCRANGARDPSGAYDASYQYDPPLAAFTGARAVTQFGTSCFSGCTSLDDSSFTAEFTASDVATMISNVEAALASPDIFTLSYPTANDMDFAAVFHLADDLNFVVMFTDQGASSEGTGPMALDGDGSPSLTDHAALLRSASGSTDVSTPSFNAYDGTTYSSMVVRNSFYAGAAAKSESSDPQHVCPARRRPNESSDFYSDELVTVSPDGYVCVLLETEGRRFEAELSFAVTRHRDANDAVVSATATLTGVRVTDEGSTAPGYPDPEDTMAYSAVPCLDTLGVSCFEGCTGLGSLAWIPFGVTQFPSRCFAGVPFTHPVALSVSPPSFSGWSSPTLDAYRDLVEGFLGFDYISYSDGSRDSADRIPDVTIRRDLGDEDYIRLALTYTEVNGELVPAFTIDTDHMATSSFDANRPVFGPSQDFPYGVSLGSTYGFSGPLEVVPGSASGNTVRLRFGDLTMDLTVVNTGSVSWPTLRYSLTYVSCPPYDAMKHAMAAIANGSSGSLSNSTWTLAGLSQTELVLALDTEDGTWGTSYGTFDVPVSADVGADEYEVASAFSLLTFEQRADQEAVGRFWFSASVPGKTGDAADKQYRRFYAYVNVHVESVPVKANSVVVPRWVTSMGLDCFTFKGFEDAEEKLEALYIDKAPSEIRRMSNFPWGIPSGCMILSATGGLVYQAP